MKLELEVEPYILESNDDNPARLILEWKEKDIGFGTIEIWFTGNEKTDLYSENMSKEFVKSVLCKMIDDSNMML